jgi:glycosyltransferase involved in cell wall biosynthesis
LIQVSLIMPVWRPRADWLEQAVNHALFENGCSIELIVVDDGNAEPVADMLRNFDDPRLRVMRVEHCGPYKARNLALAEARGAFVRFVDCDDAVEHGSTGKLLALALASPPGTISYGATMICDADLRPRRVVRESASGDQTEACLNGGFAVYVVAMLFPKAVIDRIGGWETEGFRVSGDWDFVLRAIEHGPVFGMEEVVYRYRRNATSVSRSAQIAQGVQAAHLVVQRYFERHPQQRGSTLEASAYFNLHLAGARSHMSRREWLAAAGQLARAARRRPAGVLRAGFTRAARSIRLAGQGLSKQTAQRP